MSIGKKGRVCTITYPNGNYYATSLAAYTGEYEQTYDISKANADSAYLRGECLIFDLPELEESFTDWHTFYLQFSGKYDGVDLPQIPINMSYFTNTQGQKQISFRIPNVTIRGVSGRTSTLVAGWSYDGGLVDSVNKKWCIMLERVAGAYYIAIGYSNRNNRALHVMGGVIQASLYFNATTEVNLGFPYGSDGSQASTSKGGQGSMTDTSTPIVVDTARSLFVGQFYRVYKMDVVKLSRLSNFLLSPNFLDVVCKLVSEPMDYIVSLTAMPTAAFSGVEEAVRVGDITLTELLTTRLNDLVADIDCGSIRLDEYYQGFLDYNPFTRLVLYLPFIGYVPLNVNAFMDNSIHIKYRVDALTGQCVVFISNDEGLIATHNGNCAYHIPLRSRDYSQMISGLLNTGRDIASGNIAGAANSSFQTTVKGLNVAGNITSAGSLSGNSGILTNRKPYLIIERPKISVPENYASLVGWQSQISAKLGDLTGYTQVVNVHLDHVVASDNEKAEILRLLQSGVIL